MPQPKILIRDFIETDRDALKEIYLTCRIDTFHWLNTRTFKLNDFDKDTKGEKILVAEMGGTIAGFVAIYMADNFIHHLYVHPQYTKQGVGKKLLGSVLSSSYKPFSLKCLELNQNAFDFYAAQGWQIKRKGMGDNGPYFLLVSR